MSVLVCRCPYCPGQVVLIYLGRHDLVCSVLLCPSLVCSLWSALVRSRLLCSRQACSHCARSCLVRSGLFWCCPLCFTLDWSALVFLVGLFLYSLVWFKLVCPICCARAGLVRQHDCGMECSCLSEYVGRRVCLVSVFVRSGLTVRSWSLLSGRFCLCWSGGFRTVLVWSS